MERLPESIHESWHPYLQPLFDDPKMNKIRDEVLPNCKYFPEPSQIFNVFKMPLDKIKVVILGQDPYHGGEAIGYAFAVRSTTKIPGSLEIIKKEIIRSGVERDTFISISSNKWQELAGWRMQGVFLLNTALTVEAHAAGTHVGIWQWFTREVVKTISLHSNKPVWMLWGSKAIGFKDYISNRVDHTVANLDKRLELPTDANYIIQGNHPAAELYPDSKYKFTGCNHFNLCNKVLKAKDQSIINW